MSVAYRNNVAALEAHRTSLHDELANARAARAERQRVLEEERRLIDRLDGQDPRPRRYLDTLKIAKPCRERWNDMTGDERTRLCDRCDKQVHNVSDMTREEAEQFLEAASLALEKPCVSFYRRLDGTILTEDCPSGVARHRQTRKRVLLVAGASLFTVAAAHLYAFVSGARIHTVQDNTTTGAM